MIYLLSTINYQLVIEYQLIISDQLIINLFIFSIMSQRYILRMAILFLLMLECLEKTLSIESIDFFKRYC